MSEVVDLYRAMREREKAIRAERKVTFTNALIDAGIEFESKNDGLHLIIKRNGVRFDVWPSTGKWKCGAVKGHGFDALIGRLGDMRPPQVSPARMSGNFGRKSVYQQEASQE